MHPAHKVDLIPKPHTVDPLLKGPRIELHPTPDGWRLDLINHKHDRRTDGILRSKHDAIAFARELGAFLSWPARIIR